jgi:lysozyme
MDVIAQLKRDEGCKLHAYADHLGYTTIGIGRLIDERKGGGITKEEAEYLLANDVERVSNSIAAFIPWTDNLDDARRGVLINMAFQLGIQGMLAFQKTLSHIRDGRYVAAASEMLQSKWAKQTPERAERLAKQMATGQWQ